MSARSRTYRGESAYSGCLKTLRVSYGLARYELLWANEPAQLSAAEKTLCHAKFEMDSLRTQIAQAALLLKALPAMPTLPSLVFRRPGAADAECVPIGTGVSVGRGENCEIRFEKSKEPSRAHFSVLPFERAFIVEDLGSSNGTSVIGATGKLQRRELRDGDLIRAGGIEFLFLRPT